MNGGKGVDATGGEKETTRFVVVVVYSLFSKRMVTSER